jgi:hypothetical protein
VVKKCLFDGVEKRQQMYLTCSPLQFFYSPESTTTFNPPPLFGSLALALHVLVRAIRSQSTNSNNSIQANSHPGRVAGCCGSSVGSCNLWLGVSRLYMSKKWYHLKMESLVSYLALQCSDEQTLEDLSCLIAVPNILESLSCILSTDIE